MTIYYLFKLSMVSGMFRWHSNELQTDSTSQCKYLGPWSISRGRNRKYEKKNGITVRSLFIF